MMMWKGAAPAVVLLVGAGLPQARPWALQQEHAGHGEAHHGLSEFPR